MWMGWDEMDDMDVTVARRELSLGNSHPATDTTLVVAIHLIPSHPHPIHIRFRWASCVCVCGGVEVWERGGG
jgi:hypothetical protein